MFTTRISGHSRQVMNGRTLINTARMNSLKISRLPNISKSKIKMFSPQSLKFTLLAFAFLLACSPLPSTISGDYLDVPVVGQDMGYNIQDLVDIEISRYGEVITVKRQGHIVFQGRDTTAAGMFNSGKIAITSHPGDCGPALDEISVSDQALPPSEWAGPVDQKDFTFFFNEGSGNLINSADGKHWGEVELGWGYKSGEWVRDGVKSGNKSWSSWIGAARIYSVQYSSQYTLEGFFKVPSSHKLQAGSRFSIPLLFMQIQGNNNPANLGKIVQPEQPRDTDWDRERGGVFVQENSEGKLLLSFSIWAPGNLDVEGPEFTYDKWHHVALVRDGVNYKMYLDREKVCDTLFSRWGKANLVKGILSIGQSSGHDLINYRSNAAFLSVDQIRLTSRVLAPDEFLNGAEPAYAPPNTGRQPGRLPVKFSDNFDDGNTDGWTPDSAGNWRVTDGVYHVYRGVMPGTRKAVGALRVSSVWEDCRLKGNFTIYARMGISPTAQMADPDDPDNLNMGEDWFMSDYALAFCYQDCQNSYVADFFPHSAWWSGILKISSTPPNLPTILLVRSVALYRSLMGYRDTSAKSKELIGNPVPDFVLQDLEGKEVRLADFQGKVIILDFWATWCPPCVEEIPEFVGLYEANKDKGLVIIGISLDQGGIEVVKNFAAKNKVSYTLVMGDQKVVQAFGGISGIPTTFIIDRHGKLVDVVVGGRPKAYFEKTISSLF
ncbi:MAG: redoxin domain-containing protein [Candidatus Glassbacteria bacterium]